MNRRKYPKNRGADHGDTAGGWMHPTEILFIRILVFYGAFLTLAEVAVMKSASFLEKVKKTQSIVQPATPLPPGVQSLLPMPLPEQVVTSELPRQAPVAPSACACGHAPAHPETRPPAEGSALPGAPELVRTEPPPIPATGPASEPASERHSPESATSPRPDANAPKPMATSELASPVLP